jgi:hypothetical protein
MLNNEPNPEECDSAVRTGQAATDDDSVRDMPDFSGKQAGYAIKEVEEVLKILQMKQYNKRQAQYMAGHKYIPSTEMYEVQELESLTDALAKYHPFG